MLDTNVKSHTLLQTHPTTLYVTYVTYPSLFILQNCHIIQLIDTGYLHNTVTQLNYIIYLHCAG